MRLTMRSVMRPDGSITMSRRIGINTSPRHLRHSTIQPISDRSSMARTVTLESRSAQGAY